MNIGFLTGKVKSYLLNEQIDFSIFLSPSSKVITPVSLATSIFEYLVSCSDYNVNNNYLNSYLMANNLTQSSDSLFATTSTNNFPLAGTDFKNDKNQKWPQEGFGGSYAEIEQNVINQQETLKKLSDAN